MLIASEPFGFLRAAQTAVARVQMKYGTDVLETGKWWWELDELSRPLYEWIEERWRTLLTAGPNGDSRPVVVRPPLRNRGSVRAAGSASMPHHAPHRSHRHRRRQRALPLRLEERCLGRLLPGILSRRILGIYTISLDYALTPAIPCSLPGWLNW